MRLPLASSASVVGFLLSAAPASAASTFETATLGSVGETQGLLLSTLWVGARFELTEDTTVTSLGAHITEGATPGTAFLALFEVDDATSYPECGTTECAVHTELFLPPALSEDVVLPVEVSATAGHYIVVAGTFSEGAVGMPLLPRNNTPVAGVQWVRRQGTGGTYYWDDNLGSLTVEPTRLTVTYAACGDGVADAEEVCDDGNADDTDGCLSNCTLPSCGDGFVHSGVEECDDGNRDDRDACANDCTLTIAGSSSGGDETTGGRTSTSSGDAGETGATSSGTTSGGPGSTSSGETADSISAGGATSAAGTSSGGGESGAGQTDTDGPGSTAGGGGCSSGGGGPAIGWLFALVAVFLRRRR